MFVRTCTVCIQYINVSQAHKEGLQELEQLERQYRSSRQQKVTEMPVSENIAHVNSV